MSKAFEVSQREFERLEQLQQIRGAQEPKGKTGAAVADDALQFGKKLVVGYVIAGTVLFLIVAAFVVPFMFHGFSDLNTMNKAVDQQLGQIHAQIHQDDRPVDPKIFQIDR